MTVNMATTGDPNDFKFAFRDVKIFSDPAIGVDIAVMMNGNQTVWIGDQPKTITTTGSSPLMDAERWSQYISPIARSRGLSKKPAAGPAEKLSKNGRCIRLPGQLDDE